MSLIYLEKINLSWMKIQQVYKLPLLLDKIWLKYQNKRFLWGALKDIRKSALNSQLLNLPIKMAILFLQLNFSIRKW